MTILNEEIARLQAERDRLVDGAEMVSATEDYMLEGFTELLSLISARRATSRGWRSGSRRSAAEILARSGPRTGRPARSSMTT